MYQKPQWCVCTVSHRYSATTHPFTGILMFDSNVRHAKFQSLHSWIPVTCGYLSLCSSLTTIQGGVYRQAAGSEQNLSCLGIIHVSITCKTYWKLRHCRDFISSNHDTLWHLSSALQFCFFENLFPSFCINKNLLLRVDLTNCLAALTVFYIYFCNLEITFPHGHFPPTCTFDCMLSYLLTYFTYIPFFKGWWITNITTLQNILSWINL